MKKLKIFMAMGIALCLSVGNVLADVDITTLKIAVIWNPFTQNTDAPLGWNVGGEEFQLSGSGSGSGDDWRWEYQGKDAPEIAKAQLKFFLWSLNPGNPVLEPKHTLDDSDIPDNESGGLGYLGLPNVNVYKIGSDELTYSRIKGDFDDTKPNAIVYIGAGATIDDESNEIFTMFNTAALDNVGIFFIGQRSITDARDLDPSKEVFPIMGVQRNFSIKQYGDGNYAELDGNKLGKGGDVVKEFNFLTSNDFTAPYPDFERADTVVLQGNDDDGYKMWLVQNGALTDIVVYESDGMVVEDGENVWRGAGKWHPDVVEPKPNVIHRYGEWKINAKAVEVIEVDTYEAQMNYGHHREHDLYVGAIGDKVYIRTSSPSLFLNGREIFKAGTRTSGTELTASTLKDATGRNQPTLQFSGGKVTENWILEAENPENGQIDRFIVMYAGQPIGNIAHWDTETGGDYDAGTYIGFNAGGLRDLRIAFDNESSIFKKIFTDPAISGETELKFKPYGSGAGNNGRLQAAASIWAFNENLDLTSFTELLDGGSFNKDKYYCDYIANQMAGRPYSGVATPTADGRAQFVRPHETITEFWEDGNYFRESELPATASRNPYQGNFENKIFHQIAVVQHRTQRLAIVGYQPTYLEKTDASGAILRDITKWIGYDQYTLPAPSIFWEDADGNRHEYSEEYVPTDAKAVIAVFDRSLMTTDMQAKTHFLKAELKYGDYTKGTINEDIPAGGSENVEIRFDLQNDNDRGVVINPEKWDWKQIEVKSWVEPASGTPFAPSENVEKAIKLKQLIADACINDNCDPADETETNSLDELVIKVTSNETGECEEPSEIVVIINGEIYTPVDIIGCEARIAFAGLKPGRLEISVVAKKPATFVNSDTVKLIVNNNPDSEPPFIAGASYWFGEVNSSGNRAADTLKVKFNEPAYYNESNQIVFWLWDKAKGTNREIKVEPIASRQGIDEEWIFKVLSIEKEPTQGDSVYIRSEVLSRDDDGNYNGDTTGIVHDTYKNYVLKDNAKKLLTLGPKKANVNIWVFPGKDKEVIAPLIKPIGSNSVVNNVLANPQNGSIAIIDPGYSISEGVNDERDRIYAVILDVVGNKIAEYTYENGYESGNTDAIGSTLINIDGSSKNFLVLIWNNKNTAERDVGAGAYQLYVETKWKNDNETYRHNKPVPVEAKLQIK